MGEYSAMMLKNVTLEMSCKPFLDNGEAEMYRVGRELFTQWKPLTDQAEVISLMLWTADGSEILDYSGDPEQRFEWGYWQGCAEAMTQPEHPTELEKRSFHLYPCKYRPDAAPRSYRWLKRMIEVLRECCMEIDRKPLRLVATFDNGPEFCISDFKYRRHNEICGGSTLGVRRSVICNSVLHEDREHYAAFPNGIPEGTTLGSFLGAQFRLFARDMGFDAIWLSNGMGFGRDTWGITGFLFDKTQFYPENAKNARETMLRFWRDFTAACPGVCIETRGSNFSAGVELSTDGAPLRELYEQYRIAPPVNSPWAALNFNSGLELAAWMSHIAELPGDHLPYRFYIHDPWFLNSPWLDRYGREPWDIYLPLSVSRVDDAERPHTPNSVNLLSVDDSWGEMPEQVPQEVIPYLLDALRTRPDEPGPFVWVYPFRRYCDLVHGSKPCPETVFNEELFLGEAIQGGFPLNSVATPENLHLVPRDRILIAPVSSYGPELERFLDDGGRVIFYGALRNTPASLQNRLGLRCEQGVSGKLTVAADGYPDTFRHGTLADTILCRDEFNGGPLTEVAAGAVVLAQAGDRVLASLHGNCGFVRSVLPQGANFNVQSGAFDHAAPNEVFPVENLFRQVVAAFGWEMRFAAFSPESMLPRLNISRHDNAFYFTAFCRDTTASIRMRTPLGAPILEEMETELADGAAIWHPGKCWHKRCRVMVEQRGEAVISCKLETYTEPILADKFSLRGLNDATVCIFVPRDQLAKLECVLGNEWQWFSAPRSDYDMEDTGLGPCAVLRHISGTLYTAIRK